ncbi:MAG: hypothetical protein AADX98_14125 [Thiocapsa sp. C3-3m]
MITEQADIIDTISSVSSDESCRPRSLALPKQIVTEVHRYQVQQTIVVDVQPGSMPPVAYADSIDAGPCGSINECAADVLEKLLVVHPPGRDQEILEPVVVIVAPNRTMLVVPGCQDPCIGPIGLYGHVTETVRSLVAVKRRTQPVVVQEKVGPSIGVEISPRSTP